MGRLADPYEKGRESCNNCGRSRLLAASSEDESLSVLYCDFYQIATTPFLRCAHWVSDDREVRQAAQPGEQALKEKEVRGEQE